MLRPQSRLFRPWTTKRRGRPARHGRPRLGVEALEGRLVPATLQVTGGLLTYTPGAGVANRLLVGHNSTHFFQDTAETITVIGIPGATGSGTHTVTLPIGSVPPAGMTINLGDGNDTLCIESTMDAISVDAGTGHDVIDIGKVGGGFLGGFSAPVSVDGGDGTDFLRVNDQSAGGFLNGYTVMAGKMVASINGFEVSHSNTENLTLNASHAANIFAVHSTEALTKTTINGGDRGDTFLVGGTADTLADIKGLLTLNGGSQDPFSLDTIYLSDKGNAAGVTYTLRLDDSVARSGSVRIAYSGVEQLTLNASGFADVVNVAGTSAGVAVNLFMGAGHDAVTIGTSLNSLDGVRATVTVNGEAGTDAIHVNDIADDFSNYYVVTADAVTRGFGPGFARILSYAKAESLTVTTSNFNDTLEVEGTSADTPVTLRMAAGNDTVHVGGTVNASGKTLATIQGGLTVDGLDGGSDLLVLHDSQGFYGQSYTVTANTISRSGAASVVYGRVEYVTLVAANAVPGGLPPANRFHIQSTLVHTTINGALSRPDDFTVGSAAGSLDAIQGELRIHGQGGGDVLGLDDHGDSNANSYIVRSDSVTRSGAALIAYDLAGPFSPPDVGSLMLDGGAFGDTVLVTSTAATVPVALRMGGGPDTVTLGGELTPLEAIASPVWLKDQAGTDAVVVNEVDVGPIPSPGHSYLITETDVTRDGRALVSYEAPEDLTLNAGSGGDVISVASTGASVVVNAGPGDDVFKLGNGHVASLVGAVTVDGQGGIDTLNYVDYTDGVRVNLEMNTATGAAGGVSNIENVKGGAGNDILVGNAEANEFEGGLGRDILIGRAGSDRLSAGTDGAILIGGSTAHDLVPARLEDLMAEWGQPVIGPPQVEYITRIKHLLGLLPGGQNGTSTLDPSQVFDDGDTDALHGAFGALDWFFQSPGDIIIGLELGEQVN